MKNLDSTKKAKDKGSPVSSPPAAPQIVSRPLSDDAVTQRSGELETPAVTAKKAIDHVLGAEHPSPPMPKTPTRPRQPSMESLDRADDEGMTAPSKDPEV
jgi:hypothetical protein